MYLLDPSHILPLVWQSKRPTTPVEVLDVACCQVEFAHQSSLRAVSCRMCRSTGAPRGKDLVGRRVAFQGGDCYQSRFLAQRSVPPARHLSDGCKITHRRCGSDRGRLDIIRLVLAIGQSRHLSGDRGTAECHLQGQSEACRGAQEACGDGFDLHKSTPVTFRLGFYPKAELPISGQPNLAGTHHDEITWNNVGTINRRTASKLRHWTS